METDTEIKPDIRVLKIDETDCWCEEMVKKTGRIFGIYVFDATVHVHCCEFTPSYELYFIESTTEKMLSDEDYDEFSISDHDGGQMVEYLHVHTVDGFPEIPENVFPGPEIKQGVIKYYVYEQGTSEEAIENAIDGIRGNGI